MTLLAIASVILGLVLIIRARMPAPAPTPAQVRNPARELAHARHQLGLGHRLFARLIGCTRRGLEDEGFTFVAGVYLTSRPLALAAWPSVRAIEMAEPLLELEQLLERLESLTARARSWRPGRSRGQR